jgi:hypothetical protein
MLIAFSNVIFTFLTSDLICFERWLQVQRRLAQNREAARKSRIRKKVILRLF